MPKYKVVVEQRSIFYEEAATAQEAHLIVLEDRIWDEDQSGEDTYDFEITVKEEQQDER